MRAQRGLIAFACQHCVKCGLSHLLHRSAARKAAPVSRAATVAKALPMEVATIAGEAAFIGGVALTMSAITLVVRGTQPAMQAFALGQHGRLTGPLDAMQSAAARMRCSVRRSAR